MFILQLITSWTSNSFSSISLNCFFWLSNIFHTSLPLSEWDLRTFIQCMAIALLLTAISNSSYSLNSKSFSYSLIISPKRLNFLLFAFSLLAWIIRPELISRLWIFSSEVNLFSYLYYLYFFFIGSLTASLLYCLRSWKSIRQLFRLSIKWDSTPRSSSFYLFTNLFSYILKYSSGLRAFRFIHFLAFSLVI